MEVNLIVCLGPNNLLGDKNPTGNGLLWHSKEELQFFKEKTLGNVLLFGKNTAKVVPIELMKKNRDVEIISSKDNIEDIKKKYEGRGKNIFICGGASVYEYYLKNYPLDKLYISRIKDHIKIEKANEPLYLSDVEKLGYKVTSKVEYSDFTSYVYEKKIK